MAIANLNIADFLKEGTNITLTVSSDGRIITIAASGGGSGTVNSGTQYRLAYYATTGTAVSEAGAITAARILKSDANGVPTHSDYDGDEIELGFTQSMYLSTR